MRLVITEKPSQAASLAAVLGADKRGEGCFTGNGYIVSYCFGHLLELAAPDAYGDYAKWRYEDLPIVPDVWKHTPSKDKAAQLKILKDLLNRADLEYVVNAADAGREGENIFRAVYNYAKSKAPVKRLWISSMEESAILAGFASLKDGAEYDSLYATASCRERADWLVGLNCTRLFSINYGTLLNTGRVQSPTLAMLVGRGAEIVGFVKTLFYTIELDCGHFTAAGERYGDKAAAENAAANITEAAVTAVERTEKTTAPPKLYDLTTLQREANRAYGFTAQQTLDYAQSLYEKRLATYARTDSRYLTDDMAAGVTALVAAFAPDAPCEVSQVINAAKVTDHHAILPTAEAVTADLSALPSGERGILEMLKTRLVCAVGERHRFLETLVTLEAGGAAFKAKGKTVIHNGWKDYAADAGDADEDEQPAALPEIAEGQTFPVTASVKEGATSPPNPYTEDTLLSAMENAGAEDMPDEAERKGLGTPATRAAIIEKLVKSGFVDRVKKNLIATVKAKNLIAVLPEALTSAKLTAEWENKLLDVQGNMLSETAFMDEIAAFTRAIVLDNAAPRPEFMALFPNEKKGAPAPIGVCPRCGSPVREGERGFFCDSRACAFKIWKDSKWWAAKKKPLTATVAAALLKDGRAALKGLYSEKSGNTYDATVVLDDTGGKFVNFRLEFAPGNGRAQ